jgi:hypothetical protein
MKPVIKEAAVFLSLIMMMLSGSLIMMLTGSLMTSLTMGMTTT